MKQFGDLIGRILMAQIFIVAGVGKVVGYSASEAYMASHGVPGSLLPLVILLELGGALALIVGWRTRWIALALAAFSVAAAAIFHSDFADRTMQIMFMKNLAMAGGLVILASAGPGAWTLDARRASRR